MSHIHRAENRLCAQVRPAVPAQIAQPSLCARLRDEEGEGEVEEGTGGSVGMIEGWRLSGGPWYGDEITLSGEMGSPSLVFFL